MPNGDGAGERRLEHGLRKLCIDPVDGRLRLRERSTLRGDLLRTRAGDEDLKLFLCLRDFALRHAELRALLIECLTRDQRLLGQRGETLDVALLDVNHDDYYAHSGTWWDVQDSGWLVHLPYRRLHARFDGEGSLAARPPTLACAGGCDVDLEDGLQLELVAAPASGWLFAGWSGDCAGVSTSCAVTMSADRSVTARFVAARRLGISVRGRGRVTSRPAGIACPRTCAATFASGTLVTLVARPARGRRFAGWSGSCRGRRACTLRLQRDALVAARFTRA